MKFFFTSASNTSTAVDIPLKIENLHLARLFSQSSVSNACGLDVEIKREPCITGRASVSSGGRPSGAGGAIIKNDQPYTDPASSHPINSFVKIIIFTVAGAVMVTLLAFAATRYVRGEYLLGVVVASLVATGGLWWDNPPQTKLQAPQIEL